MSKTKSIYIAAGLVLMIFITSTAFLKYLAKDSKTSISISENNNEISIHASFPAEKSVNVQRYLKNHLNLIGVSDLSHMEVKNYNTPDGLMDVDIKSRNGYVKIRMNKHRNSTDACDKLKETGEGLKEILTQ